MSVTSSRTRHNRRRATGATTIELDNSASAPQPEATKSSEKPKRKRGDRKNQYPDKALYVITEVGPAGEIIEPAECIGRFRNVIRAAVRDELNPAVPT